MCALTSSALGAGTQLRSPDDPPTSESRWNPKYATPRKSKNWRNEVARAWGWRSVEPPPSACDFVAQGWEAALTALHHYYPKDKWKCNRWVHFDPNDPTLIKDQTYEVDVSETSAKTKFRQTGASYNHAFHPSGFLLIQESISPAEAASQIWDLQGGRLLGKHLPLLRQQSDFLWFDWQVSKQERLLPNVYFCAVQGVSDARTLKLIARYIVQRGLYNLQSWPAFHSLFRTDTPEGRALLGSPAAHQCVLFLMQHKAQMGLKYIPSIRVLRGPLVNTASGPQLFPQLLFTVDDVPQHMVKPDPAPGWTPPPKQNLPALDNPPPVMPNPLAEIMPAPNQPAPPLGVPGPLNPQPGHPPQHRSGKEQSWPEVAYEVTSHEGHGKNFVRVHTFHMK